MTAPRDEVPPAERARQRGESAADRAAQTATRMRELSDDRQLGGYQAAPAALQAMLARQRLAMVMLASTGDMASRAEDGSSWTCRRHPRSSDS